MSAAPLPVFVVRLDQPTDALVTAVLSQCGIGTGPDPRWRRHAPNLLTVRAAVTQDLGPQLLALPGVQWVHALDGHPLYARWPGGGPKPVVLPHGVEFGGADPVVIAGPCAIEGPQQVMDIAAAVAGAGARVLRGGAFKPRTSPYDFGGLGAEGVQMLALAGEQNGLPIVTEVLDPGCMDLVAEHADLLQIGSRNMHNSSFLFALGAHARGRPALLKRGFGATVDEFLDAAEYFLLGRLAGGHEDPGLILCERGIRTFESSTRFTLDVAAIAVLKGRTHLPVVVDPSHPAGDRELVSSLGAAAIAAGADGLLVEVHTAPEKAWCDGDQSLDRDAFAALMARLATLRPGPAVCP